MELDHPFICKLHGTFATDQSLYLLLGMALGGDMFRQGPHSRVFHRERTHASVISLAGAEDLNRISSTQYPSSHLSPEIAYPIPLLGKL